MNDVLVRLDWGDFLSLIIEFEEPSKDEDETAALVDWWISDASTLRLLDWCSRQGQTEHLRARIQELLGE